MDGHVDRPFVAFLVRSYYLDRKSHYFFCSCFKCKGLQSILDKIDKWGFYDFNKGHKKWFLIFHKSDWRVTLFPVFI